MSLSQLFVKTIGGILAVVGLIFVMQHLGFTVELLVGLIVLIIGVWLLLGRPISL